MTFLCHSYLMVFRKTGDVFSDFANVSAFLSAI